MAPRRESYSPSVALMMAGLLLTVRAQRQGKTLTCACSDADCKKLNISTCTTLQLCYTQFLKRADSSESIIRGCVTNKTPLLCENRPPAVKGTWPLLLCCNYSMCNQQALPTQPPWHPEKDMNATISAKANSMSADRTIEFNAHNASDRNKSMTPIYISVLVIGVGLLLVIAGVAALVLRKRTRLYNQDFSINRRGYLKGQDLASFTRIHESESSRTGSDNDSKAILSS